MVFAMNHTERHRSHPDKWLEVHVKGVVIKTVNRTASQVAYVAALFHDLGKLNPNFQRKLYGKVTEYSNHSLLSAVAALYRTQTSGHGIFCEFLN